MSEHSGFFNSTTSNPRKYSAEDFTRMCLAVAGNGVAPTTALDSTEITGAEIIDHALTSDELALLGTNLLPVVTNSSLGQLQVHPGYAISYGRWYSNTAIVNLSIPADTGSSSVSPFAYYLVCLEVDSANKNVSLKILKGGEGNSEAQALTNFRAKNFTDILPIGIFATQNREIISITFNGQPTNIGDCRRPNTYRVVAFPSVNNPYNISLDVQPSRGTSLRYAREDHVHRFPYRFATNGTDQVTVSGLNDHVSYGTSNRIARADHEHNLSPYFGDTIPLKDSTSGAIGISPKYARQDHRHPINVLTASTINGSASTYARSDHKHDNLATAAPLQDSATASVGTSERVARQDHVHPLNVLSPGIMAGSASTYARSDHTHDLSSISQDSAHAFKSQSGFYLYKPDTEPDTEPFDDENLVGRLGPSKIGEYQSEGFYLSNKNGTSGVAVDELGIRLYSYRDTEEDEDGVQNFSGLIMLPGVIPIYSDLSNGFWGTPDILMKWSDDRGGEEKTTEGITYTSALQTELHLDGRLHVTGNILLDIGGDNMPYSRSGALSYSRWVMIDLPENTNETYAPYYAQLERYMDLDGHGPFWSGSVVPSSSVEFPTPGVIGVCNLNLTYNNKFAFRVWATHTPSGTIPATYTIPSRNVTFSVDLWGKYN